MLQHGGDIAAAALEFGNPDEQWLDLSTGINPLGWPVPPVPPGFWQRLPSDTSDLVTAAQDYYGFPAPLPVAGSQAAIQALPGVMTGEFGVKRVAIVAPCYQEHIHAWNNASCTVTLVDIQDVESALPLVDLLLLCNPNNPDGRIVEPDRLMQWHRELASRDGWLLVDEAFVDCTPGLSLAGQGAREGLILLRSLGKFFGLAGARVGFVLAAPAITLALEERLGPWCLPGPSAWVATGALRDRPWQAQARRQLPEASARLGGMLRQAGLPVKGATALFLYLQGAGLDGLYKHLGRQGILLRQFPGRDALRIGLPGPEHHWQRLQQALQQL